MSIAQRARGVLLERLTQAPPLVGRALLALNRSNGRIYGPRYRSFRRLLAQYECSFDNTAMLLASVNRAISDVPYYRERYRGVCIESREQFESTIGFVDRESVRAHSEAFISDAIVREDYDVCTTGGTSGKPLTLLTPKDRYVVELATMHSLWAQAGYSHDPRAVIRNHRLSPDTAYLINPVTREVIFDGFDLTDRAFRRILDTVGRFGIRFVHCYPSTAYELATYIDRSGRDPAGIRAFFSGSENVFEYQRQLIQQRLGIRFYNWYGHSEKLVLAGYCVHSNDYHAEPLYGHCELVDERGHVIREVGIRGEIVGTALHNVGMPLIRYRTGDEAEYVGERCDKCGRNLLVFRDVHGRWSGDRVYRADGSYVTTTALNLHDDVNVVINGLQYVQEHKGTLTVLVVKGPTYTPEHERTLLAHLHTRLGPDTAISIQYVERLRRHANGKFQHLISSVATSS